MNAGSISDRLFAACMRSSAACSGGWRRSMCW
jgi:hypothetical protein